MHHPELDGFLTLPSTGKGQGVLVLHAWWGLNDTIKTICNRLAMAGFTAFAPDLYHGQLTDQIADAETLSSALFADLAQVRTDLAEATSFLLELTNAEDEHLAVIGFSLGAFFALDLTVTTPKNYRSAVIYYGTRPGTYDGSQAAYLGHFAEMDKYEPTTEVDNLENALKQADRPVNFYHYKNTGHWFSEPDRSEAYNPAAAQQAWDRTLKFLSSSANR